MHPRAPLVSSSGYPSPSWRSTRRAPRHAALPVSIARFCPRLEFVGDNRQRPCSWTRSCESGGARSLLPRTVVEESTVDRPCLVPRKFCKIFQIPLTLNLYMHTWSIKYR